jgi:hypothetical protein
MIGFKRYILVDFDLVNIFKYCQPVANTGNSHLFQFVVLQRHQGFSDNLIFYDAKLASRTIEARIDVLGSPMKVSQYCRSPRLATNCAHSSAVHSVMIDRGKF